MFDEVVRIRQQLERECQAMQLGLNGYAAVAQHRIITNRYRTIGKYQEQLQALVGEEESLSIMCEVYNANVDGCA